MTHDDPSSPSPNPGLTDRALRIFSDVRAGEGATALLMLANIFLLLFSYYVIKTVREPLILEHGGAELKAYASAAQAGMLLLFVPMYSLFASRVNRARLIVGVTLFFVLCLELFYGLAQLGVANLGFYFFVWVGIFNVSIIAQFWSYANDCYSRDQGERLFPVIAIGATIGGATGSQLAKQLFKLGLDPYSMLHVAAGLLLINIALFLMIHRRQPPRAAEDDDNEAAAARSGRDVLDELSDGFRLIARKRYLMLIAAVILLLNLVNTLGGYILDSTFVQATIEHVATNHPEAHAIVEGKDALLEAAATQGDAALTAAKAQVTAAEEETRAAFSKHIGELFGDFYSLVGLITLLLQAFVVSRLVKHLGIGGVLFALPLVAMGAYGAIALGAGFALTREVKMAENATDYSIMNTGKAMIWLPTEPDEKYKAKQAIDTLFARLGDALQALIVFVGVEYLSLGLRDFAAINLVLIAVWLACTVSLVRRYKAQMTS